MKLHDLTPGSKEWLAARKKWRSASLAPAMMGQSPYTTRTALLVQFATGRTPEVSAMTQKVFDRGHEHEELFRPEMEAMLGFSLQPETITDDDEWMSATLDGYNAEASVVWECKQMSQKKVLHIVSHGTIPPEDYWQCVQQLYLTGAERLIYTVGDPDEGEMVEMTLDPADAERLVAGWKQFDEDLKSFTPPKEEVTGSGLDAKLPALRIEATGMVLFSNVADYRAAFDDFLSVIKTTPETPQEVANAAEDAKQCKVIEDAIKAAKTSLLAQTVDINDVIEILDGIAIEARSTRLKLEKAVKAAQDQRKNEIISQAIDDLASHCAKLGIDAPDIRKDIEAEMKGKRKVESLIDAAGIVLTNAKLAATEEYAARQNLRGWVMDIRIAVNRPSRDTEQDVLLSLHQALKDVGTIIGINQHKEAA